jgi:hypothetical protein
MEGAGAAVVIGEGVGNAEDFMSDGDPAPAVAVVVVVVAAFPKRLDVCFPKGVGVAADLLSWGWADPAVVVNGFPPKDPTAEDDEVRNDLTSGCLAAWELSWLGCELLFSFRPKAGGGVFDSVAAETFCSDDDEGSFKERKPAAKPALESFAAEAVSWEFVEDFENEIFDFSSLFAFVSFVLKPPEKGPKEEEEKGSFGLLSWSPLSFPSDGTPDFASDLAKGGVGGKAEAFGWFSERQKRKWEEIRQWCQDCTWFVTITTTAPAIEISLGSWRGFIWGCWCWCRCWRRKFRLGWDK